MTTAESEYARAKTSVWWDIENCEVPKNWDANAIAQNVNSALLKMEYFGIVSISAYGDTKLIPQDVQQALSSTAVRLNHVPAGVKDASDKKILVDMCLWAADNPAPANFMLISGDRDFSYALHQLRMRRYNILLAQPPHASAPLVAAAKSVWLWTSLASGGPPLTSGESSLLLNSGRCHISNYEMSKHPLSEQAQSSKPTDSTSDAGGSKEHNTREKQVPGRLPQEIGRNMPQSGKGATGESPNSHLSDKRHISQAAFVASRKSQASVSAKPIQEAELVEPVLCEVCQISCTSKATYAKHTYGKRHRHNLELQSGKSEIMSRGLSEPSKEVMEKQKMKKKESDGRINVVCQNQSGARIDSKKLQEKGVGEKDEPKEIISEPKPKAEHICRLCNVVCQSQTVFDSHLRGKKHAAMLSQSGALVDSKELQKKGVGEKDQPRETIVEPKQKADHFCRLCNVACHSQVVFDFHLRSPKHAAMLSQSELDQALNDSKKLQEKGVREQDHPKEKIAETQLQSQNAQEDSQCFEKHVAMVNQSKALIDFKKLQEKGVREKDQPREPQSQNAQENSKCFEKYVAMVNQSEALINSRKLEEKGFQEKAQPMETIPEPKIQSKNTQEHTKFFEKQNQELREKCGSSESIVKEPLPSTKDRVETINNQLPNGESLCCDLKCVFEAPKEASECFEGIVKPVNLSKGATEHSVGMKKKKKVMVRQARQASASKLCSLCVVICDSRGLSTLLCDNKAHWTNQKHTTAAFVASDDVAQSSVSAKPMKEPEDLQPVWCQVCQISCKNKVAYANHTYGKKHRHNLESQSAKNNNMCKGQAELFKENAEKKKKVLCNNQTAFDSHLKSQIHAAVVNEQGEASNKGSNEEMKERNAISESSERAFTELKRESLLCKESRTHPLNVIPERVKLPADWNLTKKSQNQTVFGSCLKSQKHVANAMVKEDNKEIKEASTTSESLVLTGPNRESRIPKESRGCLDAIPDRVELPPDVNVTEKLKHELKPKSQEPVEEAAKKEEIKGQVDNFWTRIWGKKS